jgi:hypothetical protein
MFPQEKKTMKRSPVAWIPIVIIAVGMIAGVSMILLDRNGPMKLKR